jgi:hypothetical protein
MHSSLENINLEKPGAGLGQRFKDELQQKLFYNQKCLKPTANHSDFLEEISYKVDLECKYISFSLCFIFI